LADADGIRRWTEGDEKQSPKLTYQSDVGHPLFAPGPSDPRWSDILARAPHLAPAFSDFDATQSELLREIEVMGSSGDAPQIESVIRRVDARMAQRVDRLRQCGNGVSSLAAAIAWRTLEAKLYS
jgi:DNA (cytosine-5)-methyltransferase 1